MINLLSKTGLGRSGHVRFPTFGLILHVSVPKMVFLKKFIDDSAWFLLENLKKHMILIKTLNIARKVQKNQENSPKF